MTLHATREGEYVVVHGTYGGITMAWKEHHLHAKHFAGQLLEMIKEAETEAETQRGREARDL